MPARGWPGPAMALLHMGQTQRTSSHFTRHLRGRNTGGCKSPPGKSSLPAAPAPRPYSLSVEGVLARQHPQLLLHLKIFQADGAGLLQEARREGEGGCERVGPSATATRGPAPTRNAVAGEIPLLRCFFPGYFQLGVQPGSQTAPRERVFFPIPSHAVPARPHPGLALPASRPRPRGAEGMRPRASSPGAPTPSKPRGGTAHPVHVQPPGIAFQNHLREKRRQRI